VRDYFSVTLEFIYEIKEKYGGCYKKPKKKSPKKPNFEKAVNEQLPISLTANRPINR
jgi:hypothetical protein